MQNSQSVSNALTTNIITRADTPSGFSVSELTGFSPEQVRRAAELLVRQGEIVRATVSPRRVRYFANDKLAQAYRAGHGRVQRPVVAGNLRSKAAWQPDTPAVLTPRTKITIAPPLPRNVYRTNTFSQF